VSMLHRIFIILFVLCDTLAPLSASASFTPDHSNTTSLTNGLVGYWPFDGKYTNWGTGTTQDASGNGNTGQLVNMSTTTSPVIGKIGQALKFNGSGKVVF